MTFTIGEVAKKFGLTLRTLRFWEAKKLISPIKKGSSRFYNDSHILIIETIVSLKKMGVEIDDIRAIQEGAINVSSLIPSLRKKAIKEKEDADAKIEAISLWESSL